MKKIISLTLVLILCLATLCSCEIFDPIVHAEEYTRAFLACLENDDYIGAVKYLHPRSEIPRIGLQDAIAQMEDELGIDFSDKIEFESLASLESQTGYMAVGGYTFVTYLVFRVTIDEKDAVLEVVYLENELGNGIHNIGISLSSSAAFGS